MKKYVKTPRNCRNHEAKSSQVIKGWRDKEQIRITQIPYKESQTQTKKKCSSGPTPWKGLENTPLILTPLNLIFI